MSVIPKYAVEIFWSDEDESYIANAPDLKYCSTHGDTREEALREIEIAIEAWIESAIQHGDPLPDAKFKKD